MTSLTDVTDLLNNVSDAGDVTANMTSDCVGDEMMGGTTTNIYGLRFGPYTVVSVAGLLFNIVSLLAMAHIRGRRTVHHALLVNLAMCDMTGSVLLWMYYNSPYLFPRFQLTSVRHCLFILVVLLGEISHYTLFVCITYIVLLKEK